MPVNVPEKNVFTMLLLVDTREFSGSEGFAKKNQLLRNLDNLFANFILISYAVYYGRETAKMSNTLLQTLRNY